MPNIIKPKRSTVASSVPTTADLQDGEMAVNTADKKIYIRIGSEIIELANFGGGGTVYRKHVVFTSSGTYTHPATALPSIDYDVIGGGGAGGGLASTQAARGGGGAGGRKKGSITITPGDGYAVVVGAGGVGSTSLNGADGGDSSFAGITALGGKGASNRDGGRSGDGTPSARILPTTGLLNGSVAFAWTGSGGSVSNAASPFGVDGTPGADGICNGGGGGNGGRSAGGGDGGVGLGSSGSDATVVGSGGGGAYGQNAGTYNGGSGFRGEVRITYWDTVP